MGPASATQSNPTDLSALRAAAFGSLSDQAISGILTSDEAADLMRRAALEAYPEALYAFGHGSALAGQFKPFSDLDVVVVLAEGQFWEKRCLVFEGFPVEFQTCTLEVVDMLVLLARSSGIGLGLLAEECTVLLDKDGGAESLRKRLGDAYSEGPLPASPSAIEGLRHKLSNQIVELAGAEAPLEILACGMAMFDLLVRVQTALSGTWRHAGKWVPRNFEKTAPGVFPELAETFKALAVGDKDPLMTMATRLLDQLGGPLWDGYIAKIPVRLELLPATTLVHAAQQMRG